MVDTDEVLASWRKRGFHGGVFVDPPGQVWADFVHDVDELFMVVEGTVELEMLGRVLRPAVGEEVLIPEREVHTVRTVGTSGSRWLYAYARTPMGNRG